MRWLALMFISCAVISQVVAAVGDTAVKPKIVANVDEFVDKLLKNLRVFMVQHNLDPFKVANITEEFYFNFLFQNHTGVINLANGWLQDISTIRRGPGDAIAKYDHQLLTISFDILFDDLLLNALYDAKILTFSPDGKFTATIIQPEGKVSLLIDLERITFSLQQFELLVNGRVDIDLTGISIIGPVVNVVVDAITGLFKNRIVASISDQIREAIENLLDKIPPLLPPATTTTSTTTSTTTTTTTTPRTTTTPKPTTEPTTEATTETPTEPTTEATTETPTEATTETPTEATTETPTEATTETPTEASTEAPTEPSSEPPTESTVTDSAPTETNEPTATKC